MSIQLEYNLPCTAELKSVCLQPGGLFAAALDRVSDPDEMLDFRAEMQLEARAQRWLKIGQFDLTGLRSEASSSTAILNVPPDRLMLPIPPCWWRCLLGRVVTTSDA